MEIYQKQKSEVELYLDSIKKDLVLLHNYSINMLKMLEDIGMRNSIYYTNIVCSFAQEKSEDGSYNVIVDSLIEANKFAYLSENQDIQSTQGYDGKIVKIYSYEDLISFLNEISEINYYNEESKDIKSIYDLYSLKGIIYIECKKEDEKIRLKIIKQMSTDKLISLEKDNLSKIMEYGNHRK